MIARMIVVFDADGGSQDSHPDRRNAGDAEQRQCSASDALYSIGNSDPSTTFNRTHVGRRYVTNEHDDWLLGLGDGAPRHSQH